MNKTFRAVVLDPGPRSEAQCLAVCLSPVPLVSADGEITVGFLDPVEGTDRQQALRNLDYAIFSHFKALKVWYEEKPCFCKIEVEVP